MKITVWGINYAPELTGIGVYNTDMCEFLSASEHAVTMVTSFPYYPAWKKRSEDAACIYRTERRNGVTLMRCWQYVPSNPTVASRILHEASFVLTSLLRVLSLPSPDVFVVVGPPLLMGIAARIASLFKPAHVVYHLQDLQPSAALGLGMLRPGLFIRLLFFLQRFAYTSASRVSSISPRMCQAIQAQGAAGEKILLFPNWVALPESCDLPKPGSWKLRSGVSMSMPIVTYAGSLGVKQGLEAVIEAAEILQRKLEILFVIAGNGGNENQYKRLCAERRVTNVLFKDVLPEGEHTALLLDSDICLIPQRAGLSLAFLPSKLLKILALGRPVITNANDNGALRDAFEEGNFGLLVKPGNAEALSEAILQLLGDGISRQKLGEAGRRYVRQFERNHVLFKFETELRALCTKREHVSTLVEEGTRDLCK